MAKTVSYRGYADAVKRFDIEPSPGRQRNKFNYAKRRLMTFDAGNVIPFYWQPVLPGDDLSLKVRSLIRLSNPLVSPLMDEIWVKFYFFLSYNRFVFEDFQAFMGEMIQDNPDYDDSGDNFGGQSLTTPPYVAPDEYQLPTLKLQVKDGRYPFEIQSLLDYLALPYAVGNEGYEIQSLLPRHYNLIYNAYFRDENLQQFAPVPKGMGPDKISQFQLMPSLKYQDYITGSLPFLQKGPDVLLGLAGDVPVVPLQDDQGRYLGTRVVIPDDGASTFTSSTSNGFLQSPGANPPALTPYLAGDYPISNKDFHSTNLVASLSSAQSIALAQIRLAFQLMRFYEGQARSGTRYIEYIHFMFDEYIPDVQLQRPKYIGGGKITININPVAQTSSTTDEDTSLATLAAFGVAYDGRNVRAYTHVQEHGYIIGLLTVGTTQTYQQGLQRDFWRRDRFDFYTPTLAHLSEQAVNNGEICMTGIPGYDNATWGYIGRYDEYRTMLSEVCGYFRSNAQVWNPGNKSYDKVSLDSYHLAQYFDTSNPGSADDGYPGLPHLNANFIQQPYEVINRAMNITSKTPGVPQFLADITTTCKGVRVVSKYGIPGFADHF
ncbi:major capsid protein [Sigmofec virus UA08Rod_6251]|uniref:Major capsid protein n=1 Tax=Sigmofec virus UA08Rod_6251 TaxID=2929226 RepID=A0A976R568_9VIRU|nr:major capsid protein [Sigmofec virus UA08Rod_6251]